jgi:MFS family permease
VEARNRISGTELKKSLRLVILSAALGLPFFSVINGPALTGFTRAMGANDFVYSLIMALPVLGAVVQIFASYTLELTGKRRLLLVVTGFVHRLLWIPIAFIPFVLPYGQNSSGIWTVTALIVISSMANSVTGVTFNSWMGSLVPAEIKGRFFSKRTMIYTITAGIAALVCGLVLDLKPGFTGYAIVFIAAAFLGASDISMFFFIKDPPMVKPKDKTPFFKLMKEGYKDRNYVKYMVFVALWYFGVNVAGPFFNVYMLEELHMNFLIISIFTQVTANIATILSIRFWGRLSDRYGSKPVMFICCSVLVLLPAVWIFATPSSTWIIMAISIMSGIFWPGFEMNAGNQSIWLAPEKNRSVFLANYTLVVSVIGTGAAFLCGGALLQLTRTGIANMKLPFVMGQHFSSFHLLFILSSIIRFLVLVFIFKTFREENSQSASKLVSDIKNRISTAFQLIIEKSFGNR